MYDFSLKETERCTDAETTSPPPPPPTRVIRAPSETEPAVSSKDKPHDAPHNSKHPPHVHNKKTKPGRHHQKVHERASEDAAASTSDTEVRVYNVGAFTDMRDAADWSALVQRERRERKQRAAAQYEAMKAEEQQRREQADAQTRQEAQRRRKEREQHVAAARAAEEMTAFQDRNTQFLHDQQQLARLGAAVAHAETHRKARAKEQAYQTWTAAQPQPLTVTKRMLWATGSSPSWASSFPSRPPATTRALDSTRPLVQSSEEQLRLEAYTTEKTYVRLGLAYRAEASRSRTTAAILAGAPASLPTGATQTQNTQDVLSSSYPCPPPSLLPLHPLTLQSTAAAAAHGHHAIMPLPLTPPPVNAEVSDGLRRRYYPWAEPLYTSQARPPDTLPTRDAYLPVRRWNTPDLQASMYGHNAWPDGSLQTPSARRQAGAKRRTFTTISQGITTAADNTTTEAPQPLAHRTGKRMEVWL